MLKFDPLTESRMNGSWWRRLHETTNPNLRVVEGHGVHVDRGLSKQEKTDTCRNSTARELKFTFRVWGLGV